ncbi:MAG: radical SAM family heme chaperone HemW [Spirochaetales bacterium]|uniref:Heme chaperone HemW n=1 Tax=Candidatus Thalassospirochaeta sargassi TaxID=3119039 RepID=A0AAJ1IIQ4_9SPIO|nr:radical SAM family heme chaperone HemW [Spirochaetales bacterium]
MKISLYIHIPFCRVKCAYCDFFSVSVEDDEIKKQVLNSIISELKLKLEEMDNPDIETIFIGGGTPSAIQPDLFSSFLSEIDRIIFPFKKEPCEFTTEANIGSCSRDFMKAACDGGINRLSLGVQSFNKKTLRHIGRHYDSHDIYSDASEIRDFWKHSLSIDLISGINRDYMEDVELALSLKPDHLSIYQLSVEEETSLKRQIESGLKSKPDESLQAEAIELITKRLTDSVFNRYEISNFATAGNSCLHNIRYWNMHSYIGIGPSAVSSVYSGEMGYRTTNTKDISLYTQTDFANPDSVYFTRENLGRNDLLIEHFLMGCRLTDGIDVEGFKAKFGQHPSLFIPETSKAWEARGAWDSPSASLTEKGLLFLDSFLYEVYNELTKTIK